MDDFFSGAPTVADAQKLRQEAIEILSEAKLDFLKRHLNFFEIETNSRDDEPTFAQQSLGNTLSGGKFKLPDSHRIKFMTL